jgi:prepilin-type N-terminal cleavage/methylation domain-containing protein
MKPTRAMQSIRRGFTLLEILLALSLASLVLVGMNAFIFSMGELWGRDSDVRLFERHVRAVTRFLEQELRASALPPAMSAENRRDAITVQEVRPQNGMMEKLLTFELPGGVACSIGRSGRCRRWCVRFRCAKARDSWCYGTRG